MEKGMKKRWISLYVENQVGVLSKISGLFSGKSYNLDSLMFMPVWGMATFIRICFRCWKRPVNKVFW